MHGFDQWYGIAAAASLILGCYLGGRRGHVWAVIAVLCAAEAGSALVLVYRGGVAAWVVAQVVLVVALFATLTGAYRRLRHQLALRGWEHAQAAALRERTRIAAELHDTLGHDLALLSLQAAGIQVTATEPETRERAAAIRAGAAQATATVRRLVDLLRAEGGADAVIDRARAAGMTVTVTGQPPADEFSARLITEALSNAARHAPDTPVTIVFNDDHRIEVGNPLPTDPTAPHDREPSAVAALTVNLGDRAGSGLATLAAQLAGAGGGLTTSSSDGNFRLVAQIPVDVDERISAGRDPIAADYHSRLRRARSLLATTLVAPLGVLILIATGFYAWATSGTTMEPATYRQLHVGMDEEAALRLLPPRQARIRFGAGHSPDCRRYTDGNYPLAYDTYEICIHDGVVSRLYDRTGGGR